MLQTQSNVPQVNGSTLPRESYVFILASLVNSVGSALMWPLTTIYVHNVLLKSYGDAGLALFFQSLASVLGQIVGGALYQRVGAKRLIVWSLVLTGLAQLSLLVAKDWVPYVAAMTVNGFLIAVTMPAVNAFIGFRWPHHRVRLFNAVYVSNNVGVAIGTTLAGILAAVSFNLTFLFNSVTTLGFALFFWWFMRRMKADDLQQWSKGLIAQRDTGIGVLLKNYRAYLFVGAGCMLVFLSTSAWNSGVAPYLNQEGHSAATYSFLWTINGLIILVGQPVTTLLNRSVTRGLPARLISSALLYGAAFLLVLVVHTSYAYLVVGMVIATFGEMQISPTVPAYITQTTGRSAPFYLGLVGGLGSVGRLVGPVLFGNLFDRAGLPPILLVATFATFAAAGIFSLQQRRIPSSAAGE